MNRRGFLIGLLAAPAVITTPGLLMPVRAWADIPVFIGDGIHDDTAAVQAAIDGLPFDAPHGGMNISGHILLFGASIIRVTDSIQLPSGGLTIDGGKWDGTALTDRPLFNFQKIRPGLMASGISLRNVDMNFRVVSDQFSQGQHEVTWNTGTHSRSNRTKNAPRVWSRKAWG